MGIAKLCCSNAIPGHHHVILSAGQKDADVILQKAYSEASAIVR